MSTLYAWVNDEADGSQSTIGVLLPDLGHVPLVLRSREVLASPPVRQLVAEHVAQHGFEARLVRFEEAEVLDRMAFKP